MSVINTNVKSLVASNAINMNDSRLSQAMQRLSTGSRINAAKDDAAGLAIGTRMDAQIRGIKMGIENANTANSLFRPRTVRIPIKTAQRWTLKSSSSRIKSTPSPRRPLSTASTCWMARSKTSSC